MKKKGSSKQKLWKVFSEYIRQKYADDDGYVACISCGVVKHWKELHAGHYIPKSLGLNIYFAEKNVHPQCAGCNMFRHGNLAPYALALKKKYGEGILEELDAMRHQTRKIPEFEYLEMIQKYKQLTIQK